VTRKIAGLEDARQSIALVLLTGVMVTRGTLMCKRAPTLRRSRPTASPSVAHVTAHATVG